MVRHPVDRFVSQFRYDRRNMIVSARRHAALLKTGAVTEPSVEAWRTKDLSACVLARDPECLPRWDTRPPPGSAWDQPVAYFCGQDPFCTLVGSQAALNQARAVVEAHYAVVGVMEQLDRTLAVLEHRLPRFFRGASMTYYHTLQEPHRNTMGRLIHSQSQRNLTEAARRELGRRLGPELELYRWLEARLGRDHAGILGGAASADKEIHSTH
jgi:hypothetical protein